MFGRFFRFADKDFELFKMFAIGLQDRTQRVGADVDQAFVILHIDVADVFHPSPALAAQKVLDVHFIQTVFAAQC